MGEQVDNCKGKSKAFATAATTENSTAEDSEATTKVDKAATAAVTRIKKSIVVAN